MPDLTLSLTDAQWARVQSAFTDYAEIRGAPKASDMAAWIKRRIRDRVADYEKASALQSAGIDSALTAEGWGG